MVKVLTANKRTSTTAWQRAALLFLCLMCLGVLPMWAQNIQISGVVTEGDTKEPIPGVNVIIDGTTQGTITDFDGKYSISAPSNATLVFSFIGYVNQKVAVNGKTAINVALQSDTKQLDEVVAIGYGTAKRKDVTGSVSSVKAEALAAIPVASAVEAMTGKMAGVQISTTEGSPDAELKIRVRGGGSITGDNTPLLIVDGFPVATISDIAPGDIESIDVLKDASSTAIYGSRGANGVIIVTTKSGKEGKVSVSYNAYYGVKKIAKTLDVLTPYDFVNWQYELATLKDSQDSYSKYFGNYQDMDMYSDVPSNNWQEQVYGRTGSVFNHNFSINGGTDKTKYTLSYARIDDKAIMQGSDFNRNNLSFKFNTKLNDKFTMDFALRYSDTEINGGGANEQNEKSSADSRLKHTVIYTPIPIRGTSSDASDEDTFGDLVNPFTAIADNDKRQLRKNYNMANSIEWQPLKNLRLKSEVGLDFYMTEDQRFYGTSTYYVQNTPIEENKGLPAAILTNGEKKSFRNTNTLSYDFKRFLSSDSHTLKALLGQEAIVNQGKTLTTTVHGFPEKFSSEDAFKLTTQGDAYSIDNFYKPDDNLLSFFGRLNYDFDSKYIASATFRADGSSRFGDGNKWGYFPSAAAAWRISSESFMSSTKGWLDDLKLRFSYGTAGNNNIPSGQISPTFASNTTAWLNTSTNYWAASKTMPNPDLKWETTYTRNLGLDWAVFRSRLTGTVEAYYNTTNELLIEFPVAGTGYDTQYRNMGETENKGLELTLNGIVIDNPKYGLDFSFNIGFNKGKINSLGVMDDFGAQSGWASTEIGDDYWVATGGAVGEMYGYESDGRYELSDFKGYNAATKKWELNPGVVDASGVVGVIRPGSMKLKDQPDSDGNYNGTVTVDDRKIIGDANPLHTGGFTLNGHVYGFDVSAVFNWSYGNDIYNANKIEYTSTSKYSYRNMITDMGIGNRWTNIAADGSISNDPAVLAELNANTTMWSPYTSRFVFSDWAVEDGSFLRLNTLTIGYTIPKSICSKMKIQSLRFYVTGYNVHIWTNYSGFDPEVSTRRKSNLTPGVDYSAYPKSTQLVGGLSLNF